jgi:phospholipase/carboxylesterase
LEQRSTEIAGLSTIVIGSEQDARAIVVFLHGYAMDNTDLAPFAHSMQLPALFLFPRGPHQVQTGGYAWWLIDTEARNASLQHGPRDLFENYPPDREAARLCMRDFLRTLRDTYADKPVVLAGFSQGGMLACELILNDLARVDGLALLSASRLAFREWQPHADRMHGLPVLVSHGKTDADLAYSAGEKLRDWLSQAGAQVTWVPFEEGHQIPLAVWRQLRKFVTGISAAHGG